MDSEFRIYTYIKQVLSDLGWDTRNPARGGDVYTQGEFRRHDNLLADALGRKAPESIVRIPWDSGFRYWVIEAKGNHRGLKKAVAEAQGYSNKINKLRDSGGGGSSPACFATGIAGSPDATFFVETHYWDGREWKQVSINDYATTGFLSLQQCLDIISNNTPNITHFDADPERFLKKANEINQTLYDNTIPIGDRAKVLGALLLALAEDGNMRIEDEPIKMVGGVNASIESILTKHGKEAFVDTIKLALPATRKNHRAYRKGIVDTLQHLREMNVRSAINGGDDALGKFYETFLKYANGAKDMGIVLTPRHITEFAVECVGVTWRDKVYDPTCGTGGFLVAAMDSVRQSAAREEQYEKFKADGVWGVEKEDPVYGLALVNMIFRGDGKSGLQDGDCFAHDFWESKGDTHCTLPGDGTPEKEARPFTRVLMNPPFAVSDPPSQFVDHALRQMKPGGLLFAVLPNDPICGDKDADWRTNLLKRHSVRACVKLPVQLFEPNASKGTYGLIVEAWKPHKSNHRVLFASLHDDEHATNLAKTKSKANARDNVERVTAAVRGFLAGNDVDDVPQEITVSTIDQDNVCDFSPEAYLIDRPVIGVGVFDTSQSLALALSAKAVRHTPLAVTPPAETKLYSVGDILDLERGSCPPLVKLQAGDTPVITTKETDNGIADYCSVPSDKVQADKITISANGGGGRAFYHPYSFAPTADVMVGTVREGLPQSIEFKLYICEAISANAWRFDYYRKPSLDRFRKDVRIELPQKNGEIDIKAITSEVDKTPGMAGLKGLLDTATD